MWLVVALLTTIVDFFDLFAQCNWLNVSNRMQTSFMESIQLCSPTAWYVVTFWSFADTPNSVLKFIVCSKCLMIERLIIFMFHITKYETKICFILPSSPEHFDDSSNRNRFLPHSSRSAQLTSWSRSEAQFTGNWKQKPVITFRNAFHTRWWFFGVRIL